MLMRRTKVISAVLLSLLLSGSLGAFEGTSAQVEYGSPSEKSYNEANLYKDLGAGAGANGGASSNFGSNAGTSSGAFTLSGGVTHSDALEPLPVDERAGAIAKPFEVRQPAKVTVPSRVTAPAKGSQPVRASQPNYKLPTGAAATSGNSRLGVGQIDYSMQGLDQARRNAALKAGNGRLDNTTFAYKQRMQAAVQQTLAPPLRAGTQAQVRQQIKIKVPHWLSGSWLRTDSTETSRSELPSGKKLKPVGKQSARVVDVFGTYKDKKGLVWMVMPLGNTGMVDRGVAMDCHKVKKYSIVETGKTSCLIKVQATHFVVDKRTGRVLSAYQDEELNSYRLVGNGLVRTDSSVKVFDELGTAKLLTRAYSTQKRIKAL